MQRELSFDGLVGPTHHFGGKSPGNVASEQHRGQPSNPRAAALQGLAKMRFVRGLGIAQAVLPPQPRPSLATLRRLGFSGSDEEVLARAAREQPELLSLCSSAAAMWVANAATVAPSSDTADGRVHLVTANLHRMFHRSIEAETTHRVLSAIFSDEARFVVHAPLPGGGQLGDEGAANHSRLWSAERGAVHLFAWGRGAFEPEPTKRYPARQAREASEAVARLARLDPARTVVAQQHPAGIDAGAFHTDVLAVANGGVLLAHELAFADLPAVEARLRAAFGERLALVVASNDELPVADAVVAYPFNSQLLTLPDGAMALVAPVESRESPRARAFLERLPGVTPIRDVHYVDLRESMSNGGGPACLRLRVVLTEDEERALGARVLFDDALEGELARWIEKHYRDRLVAADLADPELLRSSLTALDELTRILALGSVYEFQTAGM